MDYDIISVGNHYEVHIDGAFYSADTVAEAVEEAEKAIWGGDDE